MGVEDRDWWKERQRARDGAEGPPGPPPARRTTARRDPLDPGRPARWIAAAIVIALIAVTVWKQAGPAAERTPAAVAAPSRDGAPGTAVRVPAACSDPFPEAGARTERPGWRTGAAREGPLRFVNQTGVDRMVDLLLDEDWLASLAVPAGQTAAVSLPTGSYRWRLRQGAAWCANSRSFVRETRVDVGNPVQVLASTELTMRIESDEARASGVRITLSDRPLLAAAPSHEAAPAGGAMRGGVLVLARARDGHFFADGLLDGAPVQFMIDTGATDVAVPVALARQLGYATGPTVVSDTANGPAVGYEFRVRSLSVGAFVFEDVRVLAKPALSQPLLGMSVLRSFNVQQTPEAMWLAPAR